MNAESYSALPDVPEPLKYDLESIRAAIREHRFFPGDFEWLTRSANQTLSNLENKIAKEDIPFGHTQKVRIAVRDLRNLGWKPKGQDQEVERAKERALDAVNTLQRALVTVKPADTLVALGAGW